MELQPMRRGRRGYAELNSADPVSTSCASAAADARTSRARQRISSGGSSSGDEDSLVAGVAQLQHFSEEDEETGEGVFHTSRTRRSQQQEAKRTRWQLAELTGTLLLLVATVLVLRALAPGPFVLPVLPRDVSESLEHAPYVSVIQELTTDWYEGRGVGSAGEERAAHFISDWLKRAGLQPLPDRHSMLQTVPMRGVLLQRANLTLAPYPSDYPPLESLTDFAISTDDLSATIAQKDVRLLWLGYGIHAPEWDWDDYDGVDVRGAIVVVLANEPDVPPGSQRFDGAEMSYYGRWTYKFEEARRQGALGALIVHRDDLAGYHWDVVRNSFRTERISLAADVADDGGADQPQQRAPSRLKVYGWVHVVLADWLFQQAGMTGTGDAIAQASQPGFRARVLPTRVASVAAEFVHRRQVAGHNVLAMLPGRDTSRAVVLSAHHDHLGMVNGTDEEGRARTQILPGALDNASGVAALLALADAFGMAAEFRPAVSIVFASFTGEESNLLGSKYWLDSLAGHSLPSALQPLLNINLDVLNPWGAVTEFVALGAEAWPGLPRVFAAAGQAERWRFRRLDQIDSPLLSGATKLVPNPRPSLGLRFRGDQHSFAQRGIPAVWLWHGFTYAAHADDPGFGRRLDQHYFARVYHTRHDVWIYQDSTDGLVQQARIAARVAYAVGVSPTLIPPASSSSTSH